MFWNKKNRGREVVVQKLLQDENEVFDITIIALERLEALLIAEKGKILDCDLISTAMGTERDLHSQQRSIKGAFEELNLQCAALKFESSYDEKEVFDMAVQLFMKNLFEWYAGRERLGFFDEVDSAVIPILYSLINKDLSDVKSVFEKFVYKAPVDDNQSLNEKSESTRAGVEAWILAQERLKKMQKEIDTDVNDDNAELIFSHKRGDVVNGYIHIMKALTAMYYVSAPAKLVYNVVAKYLPEVVDSAPHINESYIDEFFDKKLQNSTIEEGKEEKETVVDTIELNGTTYVRMCCPNPTNEIMNGVESATQVLWQHGDDNCNGEVYIGDNGMVYCKKCQKTSFVKNVSFIEDCKIFFNLEDGCVVKPISKSQFIFLAGALVSYTNLEWLSNLLTSFEIQNSMDNEKPAITKNIYNKEVMLPVLQEAVKQILDKENIEYNEIIIEIR